MAVHPSHDGPRGQESRMEFTAMSDGQQAHVHITFPSTFVCLTARECEKLGLLAIKAAGDARLAHALQKVAERFEVPEDELQSVYREVMTP